MLDQMHKIWRAEFAEGLEVVRSDVDYGMLLIFVQPVLLVNGHPSDNAVKCASYSGTEVCTILLYRTIGSFVSGMVRD